MSDTNLPEGTGGDDALSFNDGADAISNLLADPAETLDLSEEDQGQEEATDETEAEGEVAEGEETEEATEEETEQEEDGPGYDKGKFAADTAKVVLKDGTTISVQDLKRGYLSQSSFTRGTQENAKERETLTSQRAEVEQTAQTLKAQRDFLLQVSQQYIPQPPDESLLNQNSAGYDPIRYMSEKADYDRRIGTLKQLQETSQVEQARLSRQQQEQQKALHEREAKLLGEVMPELKKQDTYNKFWSEAVDVMAEYGFTPEEMNATVDHRVYKIYRDLMSLKRARKTIPSVKQAVQSKPVLSGKKRMDPKAKTSREHQVRSDQLRKTGSFEAGVGALMDLDL